MGGGCQVDKFILKPPAGPGLTGQTSSETVLNTWFGGRVVGGRVHGWNCSVLGTEGQSPALGALSTPPHPGQKPDLLLEPRSCLLQPVAKVNTPLRALTGDSPDPSSSPPDLLPSVALLPHYHSRDSDFLRPSPFLRNLGSSLPPFQQTGPGNPVRMKNLKRKEGIWILSLPRDQHNTPSIQLPG